MVCIYCHGELSVANSRPQRRRNQVWRRRKCSQCGAIFTSIESIDLAGSLLVSSQHGLRPFSRDKLFVSIYDSCRHRSEAIDDANDLTDTIIAKLVGHTQSAQLNADDIAKVAIDILQRFDKAASVQYAAFHPIANN